MGDPSTAELLGQIQALEGRLTKYEGILDGTRDIVDEQANLMESLTKDARSATDPRTAIVIGILTMICADPFNTSAWDRARGMIRDLQSRLPSADDLTDATRQPKHPG